MRELFSADYATARQRCLALAAQRGWQVQSHVHPMRGPNSEVLAMDVLRLGPPDARKVLLSTSGVHGVEGHAGCGIQAALMHFEDAWRGLCDVDTAVVHVHAVNPYGFAWTRRVTQENVDLNRNFIDFLQPLPVHDDYALVHALLLPATWPPTAQDDAALQAQLDALGPRRAQMAVTKGQHSHPDGMYFGGLAPTWSHRTFRQVLSQHAGTCQHLAWIDLHTGLGPFGVGERIFACDDAGAALQRARAWWGEGVTSVHTGSSTSIPMTGPIQHAVHGECPQAAYTGICLEFGTVPLPQMLMAQRSEHWLNNHPGAPTGLARQIKQGFRDAFYPDTDAWREQVWAQGLQAAQQALQGLREQA
jgi:hypothetical protein